MPDAPVFMSGLCAADTSRCVRVLILKMYSSTLEFLSTSADGCIAKLVMISSIHSF